MIAELHRRRVFRTVALYIVGSWLLLQVADVLFPALDIPEQAVRYVLYAAVLALPVALVFAWFFDVGAHGIRRTAPAGDGELESSLSLKRRDYALLTLLAGVVFAIMYGAVDNVVETPAPQSTQLARPPAGQGPPMVAVLPFAAVDAQDDGELFAVGVHDDLLTQLAKLESLRVISRTSVMEYRETARNLREIGMELGADVILEGFVRVAGSMIRINAQLIDARTDAHLWAETYDRDLTPTNIFQVQEDIARAISLALNTQLSSQDEEQLAVIPTDNMAAYRAYRQAMINRAPRDDEYLEYLNQAVELDPGFARAWAELAGAYAYRSFWINNTNETYVRGAEQALEKVREIAKDSAEHLMAQTFYLYYIVKDNQAALGMLNRALAKMPSDIRLLEIKTWIERRSGAHENRLETIRQLLKLDPLNLRFRFALFNQLFQLHRYGEAWEQAQTIENPPAEYAWMFVVAREHPAIEFMDLIDQIEAYTLDLAGPAEVSLWLIAVARGDYEAALQQAEFMSDPLDDSLAVGWRDYMRMMTYWLMADSERLRAEVSAARARSEQMVADSPGIQESSPFVFSQILLAALEGDAEETVRRYRHWEQASKNDWTGRGASWGEICMMLAMVGEAAETVECLRQSQREPSSVVLSLDPFMPVYDRVRDAPAFVELMAEFEATGTVK